jgi:hypothetical protein
MVKLFGLVFATLVACAHLADLQGDAYRRPLSMFRDYEPAWIGYALFGMLLAIGLETARTAFRVQAELHAAVYLIATGLLAIVAFTPSYDSVHTTCALVAMFMMYVYYAVLLYRGDSIFSLMLHLLVPSLLMMASRLESYGVWQKGMILYFLAAAVVHQGLLAQCLPRRSRAKKQPIRVYVGRKTPA